MVHSQALHARMAGDDDDETAGRAGNTPAGALNWMLMSMNFISWETSPRGVIESELCFSNVPCVQLWKGWRNPR